MASITEVGRFLDEFKAKARVFGIKYRDDRDKNLNALRCLGINGILRESIILAIETEDYCQGPIGNTLNDDGDLWVFGREHNEIEIYIKISVSRDGSVCVSFHPSEHPLQYPLKTKGHGI